MGCVLYHGPWLCMCCMLCASVCIYVAKASTHSGGVWCTPFLLRGHALGSPTSPLCQAALLSSHQPTHPITINPIHSREL